MKKTILTFYLCTFATFAWPQPASLQFDRYDRSDGLVGFTITDIWRGAAGHLWVGSTMGLSMYDGVRFHEKLGFSSADTLIGTQVISLEPLERSDDSFIVATENGVVARYNPAGDVFKKIAPTRGTFSGNYAIHVDREGGVWTGGSAESLSLWNNANNNFDLFTPQIDASRGEAFPDSVTLIWEGEKIGPTLWIGTKHGLYFLDRDSKTWRKYFRENHDFDSLRESTISAIVQHGSLVLIGTQTGRLFQYNLQDHKLNEVTSLGKQISSLQTSRRFPDVVWVGTRGQGLFAWNTTTNNFTSYEHDPEQEHSLSHSDVKAIFEDNEGLLWVGTTNGLNKASLGSSLFDPFFLDRPEDIPKHPRNIYAIYEAPSEPDIVWLGVARGPVYRFSKNSNTFEPALADPLTLDYVVAIHEGTDGIIRMAGRYSDIFELDRFTKEVNPYPLGIGDESVVLDISGSSVNPDHLWIATNDNGLIAYDIKEKKVAARYKAGKNDGKHLSDNHVMSIHEYPIGSGNFWLGLVNGGLNLLKANEGHVTQFESNHSPRCPPERILAVQGSDDGKLWLGTLGSGLVHFDPLSHECEYYGETEGLIARDVASIHIDAYDRLWLTSNDGLFLLDPARKLVIPFTEEDGLQSSTFHYQAHHRNTRGELLVGGTKGFNIFDPNLIEIDSIPPHLEINRFLVDGIEIAITDEPIELDYSENDIEISYTALSLKNPSKNRYKSYLEGADETWNLPTSSTTQAYPNLAPGNYVFLVKASGPMSVWTDEAARLAFTITPPYYQALWFWILVVIFVGLLVAGAYQYRINEMRKAELIRSRIADDLHDDIGSRISTFSLQLDLASRESGVDVALQKKLTSLANQSRNVVSELRDVVWLIDSAQDNSEDLITRMEQVLARMLGTKRFNFKVQGSVVSPKHLTMTQRRHVYLLYKEILHNIVRHAEADVVDVGITMRPNHFSFFVEDNGKGFNPKQNFEGRGLHSLKRRAEQLGGSLHIQSELGKGTRVEFKTTFR